MSKNFCKILIFYDSSILHCQRFKLLASLPDIQPDFVKLNIYDHLPTQSIPLKKPLQKAKDGLMIN
jgi:hypothetical protein